MAAVTPLGSATDPLAAVVVATFLASALAEHRSTRLARRLGTLAWVLFGVFWLALTPHFLVVQRSAIEGVGAVLVALLSLSAARGLYGGRDSVFVLGRVVAVTGLCFLPFEAVGPLRRWLVETVAAGTAALMGLAGAEPRLVSGETVCTARAAGECVATHPDYRSTFVSLTTNPYTGAPYRVTYTVLVACTGIGSLATITGLVAAVRAPLGRKLAALSVALPVVYGLNLVRNAFIGLAFGGLELQVRPELVATLFGFSARTDPALVSYYLADRVLAQSASVVAMAAVTYLVVRLVPAAVEPVEEAVYLATGTEYDLRTATGLVRGEPTGDGPDEPTGARD
jgi:archaeosortase A (PGF-CTERM-specific)